jgi:hypothetical protein
VVPGPFSQRFHPPYPLRHALGAAYPLLGEPTTCHAHLPRVSDLTRPSTNSWSVDRWALDPINGVYRQDFLLPMQFET